MHINRASLVLALLLIGVFLAFIVETRRLGEENAELADYHEAWGIAKEHVAQLQARLDDVNRIIEDGGDRSVALALSEKGATIVYVVNGVTIPADSQCTDEDVAKLSQLQAVEHVSLVAPHLSEESLHHLKAVPTLRSLHLYGEWVNDDCMAGLGELNQLESLGLTPAEHVSAAAFEHLSRLDALEVLDLRGSAVTDEAVKRLSGLTSLRSLRLRETQLSDEGAQRLARFQHLEHLDLSGTRITDSGVEWLARIAGLKTLRLDRTQVSDSGLDRLAEMANLQKLDLNGTRVTDAGLQKLAAMGQLEVLAVVNTEVTADGAAMIREKLPECQVHFGSR